MTEYLQFKYKQGWRGGQVLAINPAYTIQKCASCGHTAHAVLASEDSFRSLDEAETRRGKSNFSLNTVGILAFLGEGGCQK